MTKPLLSFLALAALGCHGQPASRGAWTHVAEARRPASAGQPGSIVSDGELKPFLPARLFGQAGGFPQGSMTRMRERALSEVTRAYGADTAELKLLDARFEPRATEAIRAMAEESEDDDSEAHRLVLPGAIGYSRYDKAERVAEAQVVVGGRFIASATVRAAQDAQAAAAALQAVDTLGLSRLAHPDGRGEPSASE